MARLYDDAVELDEVTKHDIETLKTDPHAYIAVVTAKGATRYVQGEFRHYMKDDRIEFERFVMWDGRHHARLTNELLRIFDYEKYAKVLQRKKERKEKIAEQIASNTVKVGDVFSGCYGYDATIWKFYEVVRMSSTGKTIWVRELAQETAPGSNFCSWKCRPVRGKYTSVETKHLLKPSSSFEAYIKINSYMNAYLERDADKWFDADNYH